MRRLLSFLALGGVLAVAACNDANEQTPPTGPNLKRVTSETACNFQAVKNSLIGYFTPPELQMAQGYESSMESAGSRTDGARENGFAIMHLVGQVSRSAAPGSPTTGSSLTIELTKCMFDAGSPAYESLHGGDGLAAVRFDSALNYAAGGVYYVVGAGYDSKKVLAGGIPSPDPSTRLSAVAPGPATFSSDGSFTLGTWSSVLATNTYGIALVYGYPVTPNPTDPVYEWATIDPGTNFDPYALVAICDGSPDQSLMVRETGVGVLAFSEANICGLPDAVGTASGFRSHFSNQSVTSLNLSFNEAPPKTWYQSKQPFPISVYIDASGSSILGICAYLQGTNNNGQPTDITDEFGKQKHDSDCSDPPVVGAPYVSVTVTRLSTTQSLADFGDIMITKTGGIVLTVTADVTDRSGTGSLATKINVKP